MPKKPFTPNFRTAEQDFSKEEQNKIAANLRGPLFQELRNDKPDIILEAEQVAKSHGIYLEFNRAQSGEEKHWIYLIRVSIPGGGPISPEQWNILDHLSEKYTSNPEGNTSLRLTNRQNIQFHWVQKHGVVDIVKTLAECGLFTLNGCGDNTRNVMGCPLSSFSDVFNANQLAQKLANYFRLPFEPFIEIFAIDPKFLRKPETSFKYGKNLLNRKFKIAISTAHKDAKTGKIIFDNCVELLTNDMAIAPIIESGKVTSYQVYIGGGQGERNGKPTMATLGKPLAIVTEEQLMPVLDAVVSVHQEWGDRQSRHWARLKYVVKKQGIDWYREQVSSRVGFPLGKPNPDHDYGPRHLHFGWHKQPSNGQWSYGAFIENGRITDDSINGQLKTMVREIVKKYNIPVMITPNQDLVFVNISDEAKESFEADLESYGYGNRNGRPYSSLRKHSGACVGRDTCRLTYTDSEKFEPVLIDELEKMGWGEMSESIGITGCERQCFRPATKTIGLVGSGLDRYQLKLFGSEDGRYQGTPLISSDGEKMYLRSIPREKVAVVIDALFKYYKKNHHKDETMGAYHRRIGPDAIISNLKEISAIADLMEKPADTSCIIE